MTPNKNNEGKPEWKGPDSVKVYQSDPLPGDDELAKEYYDLIDHKPPTITSSVENGILDLPEDKLTELATEAADKSGDRMNEVLAIPTPDQTKLEKLERYAGNLLESESLGIVLNGIGDKIDELVVAVNRLSQPTPDQEQGLIQVELDDGREQWITRSMLEQAVEDQYVRSMFAKLSQPTSSKDNQKENK